MTTHKTIPTLSLFLLPHLSVSINSSHIPTISQKTQLSISISQLSKLPTNFHFPNALTKSSAFPFTLHNHITKISSLGREHSNFTKARHLHSQNDESLNPCTQQIKFHSESSEKVNDEIVDRCFSESTPQTVFNVESSEKTAAESFEKDKSKIESVTEKIFSEFSENDKIEIESVAEKFDSGFHSENIHKKDENFETLNSKSFEILQNLNSNTQNSNIQNPNIQITSSNIQNSNSNIQDTNTNSNLNSNIQITNRIGRKSLVIETAFEELGLRSIQDRVGGIRIRQHVNPLKSSLQVEVSAPDWQKIFSNSNLPLFIDIGSGSGRLLLVLAKNNFGKQNYLGLEIRNKLVERSISWAKELNLQNNTHFIEANATVQLQNILETYPGIVNYVSILCPDPHFKNRHKKRRVLQPELVKTLAKFIVPGGNIFVQSDVESVAEDMRDTIIAYGDEDFKLSFRRDDQSRCSKDGWLFNNPLGIPSEREVCVLAQGKPMYRLLFTRT